MSGYVDSVIYSSYGFKALESIYVTSPCCKICDHVLGKLGLRNHVICHKAGYGHCNGAYGMPSSGTLRKLIYDAVGDMNDPYALSPSKRVVSDYDSSHYWQLLKTKCQG